MIEALNPFDGQWKIEDGRWRLQALSQGISRPTLNSSEALAAKEEFLTIFYKELLRQVFKAPDLSLGDDQNKVDLVGSFGSDLMVEQLARELARKGSFDARWINLYRGEK